VDSIPRRLVWNGSAVSTMLVAIFASIPGAAGASPWRSVSAPPRTFALADYVMQPPGTTGAGEDTSNTEPPIKEPLPGQQNPSTSLQQPGSLRDTVRAPDSKRALPGAQPAAVETIGPRSGLGPLPAVTSASAPPEHARHGIMGFAPIAILVGLVALHVLIVTAVAK
jgi:hypothetical protein